MEVSSSTQGLAGALSPSRITDYFTSSNIKTRGSSKYERAKDTPASTTSIYLTPESSPGNALNLDPDEAISNKSVDPTQEISRNTDNQKDDTMDKVTNIESDVSSDSLISAVPKLKNNCKVTSSSHSAKSIPNSFSNKIDALSSEAAVETTAEIGKEALSAPLNSQSKNAKSTIGKGKNPFAPATSNEANSTSPSVPRPKMRKGSKSKTDSLATVPSEVIKPKSGRTKKKEPEPIQKNVITDFFPVRRSGRLTKSEIEKEKRHQLEQQLISKCEDGLQVVDIESKGRGVVATKAFLRGEFVVEYAGDLIDTATAKQREQDYAANPEIGCYMYYFSIGTKQCCVDATAESGRLGRLINHSREGNCCTKSVMIQNKPHLILVASKDIKPGEELSYDYGDRSKAALEAHPWLMS